MTLPLAALLLAAAMTRTGAPPRAARHAPAAPVLERVVLADGLEIVVRPHPEATRASLRLVVRSGGASDPSDRAGLAHLVEHLLFGRNRDEDGRSLGDDVKRAGGTLNAHTTPDLTKFELDAPAAAFPALAERLLSLVTDPAWELANIGRERGVLETEADYYGTGGLITLVDWALFPAPAQGGPLEGTAASRYRVEAADVERFFVLHYQPSNMTAVFTGAVAPAAARALVERSIRVPPSLPDERVAAPADTPVLPREQKLQAGVTVTLLGFALDPADRGTCNAIAALAELRLMLQLQVNGPMVSSVSVGCPHLRGNPLILAAVYTSRLDAGDLPAAVGGVFARLASNPPSAAERRAVDLRLAAQTRAVDGDPTRLAERLAELVADRSDPRALAARLHADPLPDARTLARTVGRSFSPQRRFLVHVTPTEM